ncbi:MAG: hypothetical protein OJF52_004171 [Nitrospira sp.]|nr:MAG: hypothetical protein OJF52_004171 [Nitrospira sp.]
MKQGGFGRIQSIRPGPPDNSLLPTQPEVADPDWSNGATMFNRLPGMLNERGTSTVASSCQAGLREYRGSGDWIDSVASGCS